jgi:hypothetical protein
VLVQYSRSACPPEERPGGAGRYVAYDVRIDTLDAMVSKLGIEKAMALEACGAPSGLLWAAQPCRGQRAASGLATSGAHDAAVAVGSR